MRKLLLPSMVMVFSYVAIHLLAMSTQSRSNKKNHATTLTQKSYTSKRLIKHPKMTNTNKDFIVVNKIPRKKMNQVRRKDKTENQKVITLSMLPEKYQVSFEQFNKNANDKIEITYQKTGTKIKIPANAFVSQSGDRVDGEIEIRYREFNKPSEIFTSGIPMHWQNGEYLESAGMFEIEAYQNGQKLILAPDVNMEISMISPFTDRNYNLYSFNDDSQNWAYVNDNFSYNEVIPVQNNTKDDWRNISNDELPKFVMIKKTYTVPIADAVGFTPNYDDALNKKENTIYRQASIKLQYKDALFPDLADIGKYEYKVFSHNYTELNKITSALMDKETALSLGWKDLRVIYPGQWGLVDLKFINDKDTFTVGAEPIVESVGAQKKFVSEYYVYAAAYDQARLGRLYETRTKMVEKKVDFEKDTAIVKDLKRMKIAEKVERKFLADKLMIWNCDRPFPIKPYEEYAVNFSNQNVSNISMVYAAIPGKNSVFKATDFKHFTLVNKGDMYLWALIDENTVAYLTPDMLKAVKWDHKNVNDLEMKTMSLDAFLPILDRDILSSNEKLTPIL